jgi:prevent-host-death family protein
MTIRKVDVADATESLATYIRKVAASGPVVVTEEGQPVAALVMLEDTDLESVALSTACVTPKREDCRARRCGSTWKACRHLLAAPDKVPELASCGHRLGTGIFW